MLDGSEQASRLAGASLLLYVAYSYVASPGRYTWIVYSRIVSAICFMALALSPVACNKASQNKEAVESAVREYLKTRSGITVDNMDITVTSVSFRQNEADALVSFSAKGAKDAANAMNMKYALEDKDGKWVVKGRSGGPSDHGNSAVPPADPSRLPPGHPPTTGGAGAKQ